MKMSIVGCILLLAVPCGAATAPKLRPAVTRQPPQPVCGHWVVKKVIPTSGISEAPNKAFLGLRATYLPAEMEFGQRVRIFNPLYKERRWSRARFFQASHISASELGIKCKSVLEVDALDHRGGEVVDVGTMLFIRNENRLVTLWNGVFYQLDRVGTPCGR